MFILTNLLIHSSFKPFLQFSFTHHNLSLLFVYKVFYYLSSCDFLTFLNIDFDGYFIVRSEVGQPRPKFIFKKFGTNTFVWNIFNTEL